MQRVIRHALCALTLSKANHKEVDCKRQVRCDTWQFEVNPIQDVSSKYFVTKLVFEIRYEIAGAFLLSKHFLVISVLISSTRRARSVIRLLPLTKTFLTESSGRNWTRGRSDAADKSTTAETVMCFPTRNGRRTTGFRKVEYTKLYAGLACEDKRS